MKPEEYAEFANRLGHFYQSVAAQIGSYIHNHISSMAKKELDILTDDQTRVITYANTFFSLSDRIAFEDSDACFKDVEKAQAEIKSALDRIEKTNTMITLVGGIISLGASITSGNTSNIKTALLAITDAMGREMRR